MTIIISVAHEIHAKKASVLTQVAIGFTVLVALIILIVVLIKTYKKQKGKYEVEKRIQQQSTLSVDTNTSEITPNSPNVHFDERL